MNMRKAEFSIHQATPKSLLGARRRFHDCAIRMALILLFAGAFGTYMAAPAAAVDLASVDFQGDASNAPSNGVAVSSDGNFVAFYSDANNLVPGDTNSLRDVFVRDRAGQKTERVSVSSAGAQANGASQPTGGAPAISADGSTVAFYSAATNLVAQDTNGQTDVFVRVRNSGTTELISVATDGTQGNGPSVAPSVNACPPGVTYCDPTDDGRYVAFQSAASNLIAGDTNNAADIFVRDRRNQTTERVCNGVQGNRFSYWPSISADGNLVAFVSAASNLVPGDTNSDLDVFVCNRNTGTIELVSVSSSGAQGNGDSILPAISGDGHLVAFKSLADNLVPNDNNGLVDVFAYDRNTKTIERISVNPSGGDANDFSFPPSVSGDGRFVVFGSFGTNLVPNDSNGSADVFVRDRQIGITKLVDVNDQGVEANGGTPDVPPSISQDGKQIGFVSFASNLVGGDNNQAADVFATLNPFYGAGMCPDGTCPAGQMCVKGSCVVPPPTATPTRTPTVTPTGTATSTPTVTPTFQACTDDSQCPAGKHCRTGFCKIERQCDDSDPAVDRHACFGAREACINNLCECGGDCNLDGFVFVNEINKAVKILGDLLTLNTCPAADVDGSGAVMANDIMLAVTNLGEGCQQEGQPLIFAHDRGGMVTLTVGTTVTGQSATVSVDLSGGQGAVAAAQLDLLFDPTLLDIGDPGVSCSRDPRLTDDVMSATLPDSPPAPAGLQRLRLFVGDITPPIASFSDGQILTCTFQIKGSAPASAISLQADRLNVSDAQGNTFGTQAVSGGVSILLPTPTPVPPAAAFCPGDCNGDGQVFVNEVTLAVEIMAGQAQLSDCPAADADGDGQVFVSDITRAVMSLALGCPQ
ncbi:MAG: cohesin domain-containing protein [Candidatus Binatia bacterium]